MSLRLGVKNFVFIALLNGGVACLCQCPLPTNSVDAGQPTPTINPATVGDKFVKGMVLDSKGNPPVTFGTIKVCVDNGLAGSAPQPVLADGAFSVPTAPLVEGQQITAQFSPGGVGNPGPVTPSIKVPSLGCAKSAPGATTTIKFIIDPSSGSYSGSVPNESTGTVAICVGEMYQ